MSILIQDLDHSAAMTRRIAGRQCESKKTSCAFTIEYLVTQLVKNPLVNAGDARDSGSIPGLQRSQRRKRQPTPVLLPGKFHGQRSLAGYSAWGRRMRHNWAYMHTCIQFRVQMVVELGNESRTVHEMKWNEMKFSFFLNRWMKQWYYLLMTEWGVTFQWTCLWK